MMMVKLMVWKEDKRKDTRNRNKNRKPTITKQSKQEKTNNKKQANK
jgi:hypothetical protein